MTVQPQVLAVLCTAPNQKAGAQIASTLVEERLAACVNQVSGVTSTYRWEGRVVTESEVLLVIKTTHAAFDSLRTRLVELHPYEVPEVLAIPVERGLLPYLEWVAQEVG